MYPSRVLVADLESGVRDKAGDDIAGEVVGVWTVEPVGQSPDGSVDLEDVDAQKEVTGRPEDAVDLREDGRR